MSQPHRVEVKRTRLGLPFSFWMISLDLSERPPPCRRSFLPIGFSAWSGSRRRSWHAKGNSVSPPPTLIFNSPPRTCSRPRAPGASVFRGAFEPCPYFPDAMLKSAICSVDSRRHVFFSPVFFATRGDLTCRTGAFFYRDRSR